MLAVGLVLAQIQKKNKHCGQNLNLHETQLQKYFVSNKAKFGVLTNGIEYRFYTDLAKQNIMDSTPFLVVNMEDLRDNQIEELKKFHKSYFDVDTIISTASELKYMSELNVIIRNEFQNPSDDFVRLLAKRVYDGVVTQKVMEQFTVFVKKSFNNYINDVISERLDIAGAISESTEPQPQQTEPAPVEEVSNEPKVVTTEEELEGFYLVKSILHNVIQANRINYRDRESYFNILIDNNIKKVICRLYFNRADKNKSGYSMPTRRKIFILSTL